MAEPSDLHTSPSHDGDSCLEGESLRSPTYRECRAVSAILRNVIINLKFEIFSDSAADADAHSISERYMGKVYFQDL